MRAWTFTLVLALAAPAVLGVADAAAAPKGGAGKNKDAPAHEPVGQITWKVAPDDVVIFVDDQKVGTAGAAKTTKVKPGQHLVRLQKGADAMEATIDVPPHTNIPFEYTWEVELPAP